VPYNGDSQALKTHKTYEQQLAQLLAADKLGEAVALFVTSVGVSDKQIAAMRRLPMWKGLTAMAPTLRYDTIELMEKYPATHTSNVIVPVLVLYGAASPAFMGDTANALSRTLPQARLRSLENQTHDVKADVLAPVLLEFFRQQQ
jgi:hypothetical protein